MASEGDPLTSQAADWLAKLQHEEVSAADLAEFERWRDADPAHAVAFARVEFAWERAERLRALPALAREHIPASRFVGLRQKLIHWAAAAVLAVLAVGISIHVATRPPTYVTGLGERRTVVLEDGSQVSLNTSTRLEVDFDEGTRAVRLVRGEALFEVTHDPERPFIVTAGDTVLRAVGTAFNVRVQGRAVELTVTEGIVAVDEKRHVMAGSAAVSAAGAVRRVSLSQDAIRRRVAWREGVIELKGETLEQAVEEFNRYRKDKLVVADPSIASLRVGGRFETDEALKFVNALEASFSIRAVKREDGDIYLLGPEADSHANEPSAVAAR